MDCFLGSLDEGDSWVCSNPDKRRPALRAWGMGGDRLSVCFLSFVVVVVLCVCFVVIVFSAWLSCALCVLKIAGYSECLGLGAFYLDPGRILALNFCTDMCSK